MWRYLPEFVKFFNHSLNNIDHTRKMVGFTFLTIDQCSSDHLATATIVSDLDGSLLLGRSSFPYFALTAFDIGGPLRLFLLLAFSPLAAFLYHFVSESASIQVIIFASLAGVKISSIESAARAVLPKFYAEDVHPETWRVLAAGKRRWVVTTNPRVMVEPFLKECLGVGVVMGTELAVYRGRATGFVRRPGVLVGERKAAEVKKVLGNGTAAPEIGIGDRTSDFLFMKLCKEAYVVPPANPTLQPVRPETLPKLIIFHDGRLVHKPDPLLSLLIILYFPVGIVLSILRVVTMSLLPISYLPYCIFLLGIRLKINGSPPPPSSSSSSGHLFICSHRSIIDPIFLSIALRSPIAVVTHSLSPIFEFLSPIPTVRLNRDRIKDAAIIKSLLEKGDLIIFPEGTTCREPYLLRFSSLFAELTDDIVPVAISNTATVFHGTTARGWTGMDLFFFFMNPNQTYEISFLDKLPMEFTCGGGKSNHQVANYAQRLIATKLSYKCTNFTRKDKYMALAGRR